MPVSMAEVASLPRIDANHRGVGLTGSGSPAIDEVTMDIRHNEVCLT